MSVIALTLDGSPCAETAWPHAVARLRPEDELLLIRIVHPPATGTTLDWIKGQKFLATACLEEKKYEMALTVRKISTVVRVGSPRQEILRVLRERHVDLLVLASHGDGGWKRTLLGSVSEGVARRAPCPVWIVPPGAGMPHGNCVLVPLDCSPIAENALRFVREQLTPPGRILLLSAQDGLTDEGPLRAYLSERAHQLRRAGWSCETMVSQAAATEAILALAETERPSLLVMGTHGRRGLARWALGSVAERVVRESPCPVVLVNATADWSQDSEEVTRHAAG